MTARSDTKQRLLNRLKSGAAPDRDAQVIPRRPAGNTAPQSMNQEQVWTHVQMMGDTPAYNELITLHRRGPLDIPVLERTLDEMNRRHEMWRTTFAMGEDEPEQIVHPSAPPVKLRLFDLRSLPAKDRAQQSVRLASADAAVPFHLKQLPLWRAIAVRLGEEEYQIHFTLHHLLVDGTALYRILLPEVTAIYDAFSRMRTSPLPDPVVQYADYAVWQRRTLTNEAMAPHLAYWKQRLANPAAPLAWPNFKPRPEVQTYRGATEVQFLPSQLVDPLRALSASQSATLFMALATGLFILLHRYTGQTDITLGTPAASRTPETENIMGYFLNMMPVRVDLSGNPTFNETLHRVRSSVVDALEHGSVPLLRLLREIRPPHDPSRNPLFQIMISLEPQPPTTMTEVEAAWDLIQPGASSGSTKMDMYLNLSMRPDGLTAPILFNPDLLDAASIRRMFADWRALLEAAIARPHSPIADLPLPAVAEAPAKPGPSARLRRWLRF